MHMHKNFLLFTLSFSALAFHVTTNCAELSTSKDDAAMKMALNQRIVSEGSAVVEKANNARERRKLKRAKKARQQAHASSSAAAE